MSSNEEATRILSKDRGASTTMYTQVSNNNTAYNVTMPARIRAL